jgi:hypothetical protein
VVVIKIGTPAREYRIHVDLISLVSAYFERALKILGGNELSLDDVHSAVFDAFVDWLYNDGDLGDSWDSLKVTEMLRAIVFAHTYMMPLFHAAVHNATATFLINRKFVPNFADITYVFENLPKDHALQELLVELVYVHGTGAQPLAVSGLPKDFVKQVEGIFQERGIFFERPELDACDFHVHESEKERSECQRIARDGY